MAPPFVGVAVNVTFVPAQIELPGFAEMLTDGVTVGVTVIVMALDDVMLGNTQESDDNITQTTWSPFANALFE